VSKLLPLFPLDLVLFPRAPLPLHIFEERYKEMIAECLREQKPFGLVRTTKVALASVGCSASIVTVLNQYEDGRMDIVAVGERRFQIEVLDQSRSFLQAQTRDFLDDSEQSALPEDAQRALDLHAELIAVLGDRQGSASLPAVRLVASNPELSYLLGSSLPLDLERKQGLLEMKSEQQRILALISYYEALIPGLRQGRAAKARSKSNGHVM